MTDTGSSGSTAPASPIVVEEFDGAELDRARWVPAYLPAWESREQNAAQYRMTGTSLVLEVTPEQGLWSPSTHRTPLRTSTIASGDWSGPLGSERGPQPYAPGLTVRQEQPRVTGWLVSSGFVEIRCRMDLTARSMAALWLAGWDEARDDGGELCVVEIFGTSLREGPDGARSAEVGIGIKAKEDPRLTEDFAAPRLPIDVADYHVYRVDWTREFATFSVDGEVVRRCSGPPTYPMVLMLGVFDFPDAEGADGIEHVPTFEVDRIVGTRD